MKCCDTYVMVDMIKQGYQLRKKSSFNTVNKYNKY